jgi:hypothetical protein
MDDLVFMLLAFKAAKLFALRISLLGVSIQSRLTNAAVRLADFLNLGIRQTKSRSAALLEFGERTFVWRAGTSVAPKSLRRKLGIYLPFSFQPKMRLVQVDSLEPASSTLGLFDALTGPCT